MNFDTDFIVAGGIARAECRFTPQPSGQHVMSVSWFHNTSMQLPVAQSTRVIVSTNIEEGESTLEVDEVQHSDAGLYSCRVLFANPQDTVTDNGMLRVASESLSNVLRIALLLDNYNYNNNKITNNNNNNNK